MNPSLKRKSIFQTFMFGFHFNFQGCISTNTFSYIYLPPLIQTVVSQRLQVLLLSPLRTWVLVFFCGCAMTRRLGTLKITEPKMTTWNLELTHVVKCTKNNTQNTQYVPPKQFPPNFVSQGETPTICGKYC